MLDKLRGLKPARLADLRPGDRVFCDEGFSCIPAGARRTVCADERGELYVPCALHRHYLVGQAVDASGEVTLAGMYADPENARRREMGEESRRRETAEHIRRREMVESGRVEALQRFADRAIETEKTATQVDDENRRRAREEAERLIEGALHSARELTMNYSDREAWQRVVREMQTGTHPFCASWMLRLFTFQDNTHRGGVFVGSVVLERLH